MGGLVFVVDANNAAFFWMPAKAGIRRLWVRRTATLAYVTQTTFRSKSARKARTMLAAAAMTALLCAGYGRGAATAAEAVLVPPATLLAPDTDQVTAMIRFLEESQTES